MEAIDASILTAATTGFPAIVDKNKPTLTELSYEQWNAKTRNIIFSWLGQACLQPREEHQGCS